MLVFQKLNSSPRWDCSERRRIIIPTSLQKKALDQLYVNHMGIEKIRKLARESIYSTNIIADMENTIKNCLMCLDFQATQPKDMTLPNEKPERPWQCVGADIFSINNKHYLLNK